MPPLPVALPVMGHHWSFDALADRYDRLHDLQADPIGWRWPAGLARTSPTATPT
jgi:hypothetical protein